MKPDKQDCGVFTSFVLPLVGRATCRVARRRLVDTESASAHLLLALLPTTGMAVIALYIAIYMWKYGNDASIVVQSAVCNGWSFLFLGTLALLAGQVPPEVRSIP